MLISRSGALVVVGVLLFGIGFKLSQPTPKASRQASSSTATTATPLTTSPSASVASVASAASAASAASREAALDPARAKTNANDLLARVRAEPSSAFLIETLSATDPNDDAAKLEAIDALVARKHTAALPKLIQLDPASDPYLGPSIIVGLGELGAATTSASDRDATLARLLSLLKSEKDRRGSDSAGYIVTIIEALGTLHHPASAPTLERELFDPQHDVSTRTTIVVALKQIGQRSSVAPLTRLRALPQEADSDHATALNRELLTAIDEALESLSK